jgi:hypothetical protein
MERGIEWRLSAAIAIGSTNHLLLPEATSPVLQSADVLQKRNVLLPNLYPAAILNPPTSTVKNTTVDCYSNSVSAAEGTAKT